MIKIKIGDKVSDGGIDVYTVEDINKDGIAKCHWECGQYEFIHTSKLKKLNHFYIGGEKIKC